METTDISRDKLISDMKVVIADADEMGGLAASVLRGVRLASHRGARGEST